ncbi:hypothetical protein RQP46_006271 [Phenoliferia psychrophenolica]
MSRKCQKADWKHHKVVCGQIVRATDTVEVYALADPHGQLLENGFTKFSHSITEYCLSATLANAYKLHTKPYLQNTHALLLEFEFDSRQATLQNQFVLHEGQPS